MGFDRVKNFLVRDVCFGDSVALVADDHNDVRALNQKWVSHDIVSLKITEIYRSG
jgi:hypothetical protein